MFEEVIVMFDLYWKCSESLFEIDVEGVVIKLSFLAYFGDILDNDFERTLENYVFVVEYRRMYNELKLGLFGLNVMCVLCEELFGGLFIDDARI